MTNNKINSHCLFEKYSNSFLKDFNFDCLLRKFEDKKFLSYKKGSFIYKANEPVSHIYFILSGVIEIRRNSGMKSETICEAVQGDVLGLSDALSGDNFAGTAVATSDANVFAVTKSDLLNLTGKNDEFNLWTLKYLNARIEKVC